MEFIKKTIIEEGVNIINFGQINKKPAIIISKYKIEDFKFILDKLELVDKKNNYWTFKYNDENINLIYPCDKYLVNKSKKFIIIHETKNQYNNKILPYINSIFTENTKWIYNMINKEYEKDKLIFKDEEIFVCKDLVWKTDDIENFYILAFPIQKLKTIRDLRKKHIPILQKMKQLCVETAANFDLNENQLYFFFHYHPSFYHLHLHCCIINHKELSPKFLRCKMLHSVIKNLERNSYYYKNSTIDFEIPESHIIVKLLNIE